jgi:hypothetical protein
LRCGRGPGFCGTASIAPRPRRTSCTRRKYRVPVFGSAGVIGGRDGGMGVSGVACRGQTDGPRGELQRACVRSARRHDVKTRLYFCARIQLAQLQRPSQVTFPAIVVLIVPSGRS